MRLGRAFGSLKLRLGLAAVFALALGIGTSTTVLVLRAQADTLADYSALEVAEAVRVARVLSLQVVQQQQALAVLAQQLPPPLVLADSPALRQKLQGLQVLLPMFDSITLVDARGRGILTFDSQGVRPAPIDISDRTYFHRSRTERRPLVSELVVSRVSQEVAVLVTQPLPQDAGLVVGALRLRTRNLLAGLAEGQGNRLAPPAASAHAAGAAEPGEALLVMLTDAHGRVLAHPNPELIGAPMSAEPGLAAAVDRWRQAGAPVEPAGLDVSDSQHLVAVAGVAGPDWLVWRSTPRSTVLAPLARARSETRFWALGLALTLSLALLGLLALLLRPLSKLEARAERLFDPGLDPQAGWPGAGGEIGRLERVLRRVGGERAALEATNHRVLQRLESVMAAAPVGIAFARQGRFELVSHPLCQLLGRDESQLLGQPAQLIFASNEDYLHLQQGLALALDNGQAYSGEWQLLHASGRPFWARLRAQPVDAADPAAGTIWTANDITQEISTRQALEWAAHHDPLTGLANRAAFDERVARLFAALPRSLPAALVLLDLDRFKPINDQHGHAAGDAMLRAVAAVATPRVRPGDLLVRLGGDEFAVVLERCSAEAAQRVAEDLRSAIANLRLPWAEQLLSVDASAGLAMLDEHTPDAAAWVAAADRACYEAKAAGRGRVQGPLAQTAANAAAEAAAVSPADPAAGPAPAAALRLVGDRTPR